MVTLRFCNREVLRSIIFIALKKGYKTLLFTLLHHLLKILYWKTLHQFGIPIHYRINNWQQIGGMNISDTIVKQISNQFTILYDLSAINSLASTTHIICIYQFFHILTMIVFFKIL